MNITLYNYTNITNSTESVANDYTDPITQYIPLIIAVIGLISTITVRYNITKIKIFCLTLTPKKTPQNNNKHSDNESIDFEEIIIINKVIDTTKETFV